MMLGNRILLFFILMAIFSAVFAISAEANLPEEEVEMIMEEFESMVEGIDAFGIFLHNTALSLPMFIPGFGIIWGMFSAFSTGIAFAAIKSMNPLLEQIPALSILFMTPFGLMEVAAYSIAMSRSYMLIHKIIKKVSIRSDIPVTLVEIIIVVSLLLVGAYVEYYMIEMSSQI
ncbi:MAG TPA: stage II sporulation protein M [Candidatus Nitrosopelagicus sp.]|nr:stage II sporulation protein M [Candidatus Nitrosopelagicus sp.]